jgi:hypothetical protein
VNTPAFGTRRLSAPAGRDVVRDDASLGLLEQMRAFEVNKPASETLQAPVAEAVDKLRPFLPWTDVELPAQFAIGVGKEVSPVNLEFDVIRRRIDGLP